MSRTILITGASEGIGFETACLSAARGDRVLLVARNADRLAAAAARIGGAVETAAVDLSDPQALDAFLAALDARGYLPDVLVNNAGQGWRGSATGPRPA
jgi:short-subunit dehydrogenase